MCFQIGKPCLTTECPFIKALFLNAFHSCRIFQSKALCSLLQLRLHSGLRHQNGCWDSILILKKVRNSILKRSVSVSVVQVIVRSKRSLSRVNTRCVAVSWIFFRWDKHSRFGLNCLMMRWSHCVSLILKLSAQPLIPTISVYCLHKSSH